MEPSAADVAAVQQSMGQPAPQAPAPQAEPVAQPTPQPAFTPGVNNAPAQPVQQPEPTPQQQPAQVTPQPAPTQQAQDPFSMMFAPQQQPEPQAQPTQQPTEPTPQPQQQPAEPQPAPQAQPAPQQEPQYQSFDDYMKGITEGLPQAPEAPDPSKINPEDEEGIKNFFDDLVNTAVQRASAETQRNTAIQNKERALWDAAFEKYPSLRNNTSMRDIAHNIRMGEFRKGIAMTPTQAADKLLEMLREQHQQGVADATVVTTMQQTQPTGGGGQAVPTTIDSDNLYKSLQVGGEDALAAYLDTQVKAGNL